MSSNDVVLLADMVEKSRSETNGLNAAEQEAYFVSKQFLKDYRPSHDDLLSGLVDGEHDGGLDAIYMFVNGHCIRDDVEVTALGRHATLDLVLTQVKNARGFSEAALDKLMVHLPEILSFGRDEGLLASRFSPKILELTRRFLAVYRGLDMPTLRIFLAYAALKATEQHPNTKAKAARLEQTLSGTFSSSEVTVSLLGAGEVAEMARRMVPTSKDLTVAENPISTDRAGGYLCVVSLDEYQRFITDLSGRLDAAMFEANVRDYEGETPVNRSIQESLEQREHDVDFWWLNNGVTIVADGVRQAGKLLKLESPQIVNGLQTSHEIYKRGREASEGDRRSVLVKVIQAADESVRDRIIKATNSQTLLGLSAVRATDKVQRQIEEHLRGRGLFYERRKNYYSNQNIPLDKLVSIDQMGQAVMAIVVHAPHISRGRLSTIFDEEIYRVVFDVNKPVEMYARCVETVRSAERYLRNHTTARAQTEDLLFHVAMVACALALRKYQPAPADLASPDFEPTRHDFDRALAITRDEFGYVAGRKGIVLLDQVAKDALTTRRLQEAIKRELLSTKRS